MGGPHSDAFVFFGATGDLAFKKIFPALQAMVKRGHLSVPVIGVARSGDLEKLRTRMRDSLEEHGGIDPAARVSTPGGSRRGAHGSMDRTELTGSWKGSCSAAAHAGEPADIVVRTPGALQQQPLRRLSGENQTPDPHRHIVPL